MNEESQGDRFAHGSHRSRSRSPSGPSDRRHRRNSSSSRSTSSDSSSDSEDAGDAGAHTKESLKKREYAKDRKRLREVKRAAVATKRKPKLLKLDQPQEENLTTLESSARNPNEQDSGEGPV